MSDDEKPKLRLVEATPGLEPVVSIKQETPGEGSGPKPVGDGGGHVLADLSPLEQDVLRLRLGLDGSEPKTPDEIAETLGCSVKVVEKLEARARQAMSSKERRDPPLVTRPMNAETPKKLHWREMIYGKSPEGVKTTPPVVEKPEP